MRATLLRVRWVGEGSELWRVRVDLFATDGDGRRVSEACDELRTLLTEGDGYTGRGEIGADQGTGVAARSVVGLLFWVRANDVGQAAVLAVETARRAGEPHGVGPGLYDVTVIPRDAVALPSDRNYPQLPD